MRKLSLFLLIGLLVAAARPEEVAAEKKQEKLEGKWKLTSKIAGAVLSANTPTEFGLFIIYANNGNLEVKGDKLITRLGKETLELTIVLDQSKSPKTVDAKTGKGKAVFRGIYELGKDSLRLCISPTGDRPKAFKNTVDTPLFEYKRE